MDLYKSDLPRPRRKKESVPRTCETCGDRLCRRKWRAVSWRRCVKWRPSQQETGEKQTIQP